MVMKKCRERLVRSLLFLCSVFALIKLSAVYRQDNTSDSASAINLAHLNVNRTLFLQQYKQLEIENVGGRGRCLHTMTERAEKMRAYCRRHGDRERALGTRIRRRLLEDKVVVLEPLQLVVCLVPKVMSTSLIIKLHELLTGEVDYSVGWSDLQGRLGARYLSSYTPTQTTHILNTYTKILVVRHPLVRVLSAYIDKMEKDSEFFFTCMAWYMAANMRYFPRIRSKSLPPPTGPRPPSWRPSFSEFVTYITDGLWLNEHWVPMVELARPCQVGYTYIAHLETLPHDMNCIWRGLLNVSTWSPRKNAHNATSRLKQYYSHMSDELFHRLVAYLAPDFEAFGYKI